MCDWEFTSCNLCCARNFGFTVIGIHNLDVLLQITFNYAAGKLPCSYEWPPTTIFIILIFKTIHLHACQGTNLLQKRVDLVGIGGYDSSEYAIVLFVTFSIFINIAVHCTFVVYYLLLNSLVFNL